MARTTMALLLVATLLLAACEATTDDPPGDAPVLDLVEAGVDLRTETTRLFVRYADGAGGALTTWDVSADGDTAPELTVSLGSSGFGQTLPHSSDRYEVRRVGAAQASCSGYVPDGGFVDGRVEITVGSPCFAVGNPPAVPEGLRVRATSVDRSGLRDETGWTDVAPRSE